MEQLASLSVKQGIYLAELYEAMVTAREKGKIKCQNLLVEYRCSLRNEAIFNYQGKQNFTAIPS